MPKAKNNGKSKTRRRATPFNKNNSNINYTRYGAEEQSAANVAKMGGLPLNWGGNEINGILSQPNVNSAAAAPVGNSQRFNIRRNGSMDRNVPLFNLSNMTNSRPEVTAAALDSLDQANVAALNAAAAAPRAGAGGVAATVSPWRVATGPNPFPRQTLHHYPLLVAGSTGNIAEIDRMTSSITNKTTSRSEVYDLLSQAMSMLNAPERFGKSGVQKSLTQLFNASAKAWGLSNSVLKKV